MGGMWEHVNGLHLYNLIISIEISQITCLCGGVAAHIDYAFGCGSQYGLYHVASHSGIPSGTWRVGDDHVRVSVLGNEPVV